MFEHSIAYSWLPCPKVIILRIIENAPRPFDEDFAYLSLALDADSHKEVTVSGYAQLWTWSRGRVKRFLDKVGAKIVYPEKTSKRQNQRGQIVLQYSGGPTTVNGQIKLFVFGAQRDQKGRSYVDNGQNKVRSQVTTIDTKTEDKTDTTNTINLEGVNEYTQRVLKDKQPENPGGYASKILERLSKQNGLNSEDIKLLETMRKREVRSFKKKKKRMNFSK
jgi:hypothetical protein